MKFTWPVAQFLNPLIDLKKYHLLLFMCVLLASSCKKEQIELLTQEIDTGTSLNLYDIFFANDSIGYACGGDKWTKGVFTRTLDGGKTWSKADSIYNVAAYAIHFFTAGEGIVAGNASDWATTTDSGRSFILTNSDYHPINDIALRDKNTWVRVGGEGFADGFISSSSNAGASWKYTHLPNNMTAVQFADSNTVFASGYGVIYRSSDAGANFSPLEVRGDFFIAMDFLSGQLGYFAGYEGSILKTSDGGNSFQKVRGGNAPFSPRVHFQAIKFWNESVGYVVGENGVMFKTENGGADWKKIKSFTNVTLRAIHLFSAESGTVCGDNGKMFLFKQ